MGDADGNEREEEKEPTNERNVSGKGHAGRVESAARHWNRARERGIIIGAYLVQVMSNDCNALGHGRL